MKPANSTLTVLKHVVDHIPAYSVARLFTVLRSVLWDRLDMYSVLEFCGTAPRPPPLRSTPGQAYLPGFVHQSMGQHLCEDVQMYKLG